LTEQPQIARVVTMQTFLLKDLDALLAYQNFPGDESARVYLHGLGSSAIADFPAIATASALGRHRALLLDLLGHGFSERPAAFDYSQEGHALKVAALLDNLGLAACDIVGHSLGGSIAIVLADRSPRSRALSFGRSGRAGARSRGVAACTIRIAPPLPSPTPSSPPP
jgi:pimeloyl-ACP methyl ester carboxylesterase